MHLTNESEFHTEAKRKVIIEIIKLITFQSHAVYCTVYISLNWSTFLPYISYHFVYRGAVGLVTSYVFITLISNKTV